MKKIIFLFIISLLFLNRLEASPPTSSFTYAAGSLIQPSEVQQNESNIYNYLSTGVDTIYDGSIVNADINASAAIGYSKLSLGSSILSSDIKDGEIVNSDISSSAAIADSKLAQITTASKVSATAITGGVVLPSGALFYMITGSCPTGTTDVTATYTGKFLRVNATQDSTGGSDTVTITEANLPSHTHPSGTLTIANESAHTHIVNRGTSTEGNIYAFTMGSYLTAGSTASGLPATSAGTAHTHTISGSTGSTGSGTATTVTNPYFTAKACQVD